MTKKILAAALLLVLLSSPVFAQEEPQDYKWTVRTSAAYLPSVPTLVSLFGAIVVGIATGVSEEKNETLDIHIPPYFSFDAMYSITPRWSVGLTTGYAGSIWNVVDKDTKAVHSSTLHTFVPVNAVGRFNYLNKPKVKLYGSLEAGAILSFGGGSFDVTPNFQVNPIGVEWGKRFFGMAELGVGMTYFGGRLGVGYRF